MKRYLLLTYMIFATACTLNAQDVKKGDIFAGAAQVGITTGPEGTSGISFLPRLGYMFSEGFGLFADLSIHNRHLENQDITTTEIDFGLSGRFYFNSNFFTDTGFSINAISTEGNSTNTYGLNLASGHTFLIGKYAYLEPAALLLFGFGENENTIDFGFNVSLGFHISPGDEKQAER